jgi:uncharacterized protein
MANFTPVSAAVGGALIGLSAVLLMLFTGRIAGVSGIFDGLINPQTSDRAWRAAFIAGLIAAPVTAVLVGYPVSIPQMPGSYITIVVGVRIRLRIDRLRHDPASQGIRFS